MKPDLFPIATLCRIDHADANKLLTQFAHALGPIRRGCQPAICHALFELNIPVAVTTTSPLIAQTAGGLPWLTGDTAIELSRLAAARPALTRLMLRAWREFCFPQFQRPYAISYQDARRHTGNTYRFDGWLRVARCHSGPDTRSGRPASTKWLWIWPPKLPQHLEQEIDNPPPIPSHLIAELETT